MSQPVYDFVAIGVGPFNLGLACLTSTIDGLKGVFLDKREGFDWHPGMMLESATLQTPFLSDLVTLADPTHPLSFLSYIKQQGRIYSFYIREDFFLMRKEYNQYCQWACEQLDNLRFNTQVNSISYDEDSALYRVEANSTLDGEEQVYFAKKLVLGTGTAPFVPECCEDVKEDVIHSSRYLYNKEALQKKSSITVVGSGQSAAEIYHDLLQEIDVHGYELNWITRSPRYFPLEYSKLTLEMTSPEYVDYFHDMSSAKRDELIRKQKHLYKGINSSLINEIYDLLYVKRLSGAFKSHLLTNSELTRVEKNDEQLTLTLHQTEQGKDYQLPTEALVLSTGYSYQLPDFLSGIAQRIQWDDHGRFDVNRNYSIDKQGQDIFVQNAELHTHGFVTPDLGMACYRNSYIIRELTGVEHYPIEKQIAFQEFAALESHDSLKEIVSA
ncbi:lysine N(6)-hydroxylase/L-ornithine N(5)-oxygenase family protein [Pleionea sp. CnH1-48]|uniref:lysine N(6)-hydroxylase/L-ornithine N(5)-oxygenase family protein n=1 Tax=Pleionea sp. CnH1-48 TaxID=2954494 RepID=UPI002097293A|nr:lysine N(6)-hydroxylase/L-ornithine N(5)-oxygenase family protein [Pleionea sp. CnH1-48]MCO7224564.1 lysine N(6)-hydroxylase/L-ornithine N(5)-oxygenase family protein [Pleionea sp. CnH1-48]